MIKPLLILIALSLTSLGAVAQVQYGSLSGYVIGQQRGSTNAGLIGAMVEVLTPRDTLRTVSNALSTYYFKRIPVGKYKIRVSYLSYRDVVREVEILKGKTTEISISMIEKTESIESVEIRGRAEVMRMSGDTIIYNAAAVPVQEGDETLRIMEQLPGVIASEDRVNIMGRDIARTYIDGKLIFGGDPMAALKNLLANDVIHIKVYDEFANRNPNRKKRKGAKTERVINIETKSKLISAITGHAIVGYGADLGQNGAGKNRYLAGATANFFSEKLLLSLNAFSNNINRMSNSVSDLLTMRAPQSSYDRVGYVQANVAREWNQGNYPWATVGANYSYEDHYSLSESRYTDSYFGSAESPQRRYFNTQNNLEKSQIHHAETKLGYGGNNLTLVWDQKFMTSNKKQDYYTSSKNLLENQPATGGWSEKRVRDRIYNLDEVLSGEFANDHVSLRLLATLLFQNGDGSGIRRDTTSSSVGIRRLESSSIGKQRKYDISTTFEWVLSQEYENILSVEYKYQYDNSHRKEYALNMTDMDLITIDSTNTYDYTVHNQRHIANAQLHFTLPTTTNIALDFGAAYQYARVLRDEYFAPTDQYAADFQAVLPSAGISSMAMTKSWYLTYKSYAQLPSVEQLRAQIDDRNPYLPTVGNPNLKQQYMHDLILSCMWMLEKGRTLAVMAQFSFQQNLLAMKRTFYPKAEYLPQWNYTIPAQSTLTTYENMNGGRQGSCSVKWNAPIGGVRMRYALAFEFQYADLPSFIGTVKNKTQAFSPSLNAGMNLSIAKIAKIGLLNKITYSTITNSADHNSKYIQESVGASVEINNILKHFYLHTTYNYSFYHNLNNNLPDVTNHVWNMSLGYKVLKNRGSISFSVYDILNRNSGFKTMMYSNYIHESWMRSFGRYFTFNLLYKFNRSKSGVQRSDLHQGNLSPF